MNTRNNNKQKNTRRDKFLDLIKGTEFEGMVELERCKKSCRLTSSCMKFDDCQECSKWWNEEV